MKSPLVIWSALTGAPLIALFGQLTSYALVAPSCHSKNSTVLMVASAAAFSLCAALTALVWWRRLSNRTSAAESAQVSNYNALLLFVALAIGAFFTLVVFVMWIPQWVLSPCA